MGTPISLQWIMELADQQTYHSLGSSVGVNCGYCNINGRSVFVSSVKGAVGQEQGLLVQKTIRQAVVSGKPFVLIWDSTGVAVNQGIRALEGYGTIIQALAEASGVISRVMAITGKCVGSAAIIPGLMDVVIADREAVTSYVNPPEVVKMVTKENLDLSTMASADVMEQVLATAHLTVSGLTQLFNAVSSVLSYLPDNWLAEQQQLNTVSLSNTEVKEKYTDMQDLIYDVVDRDSWLQLQTNYAKSIITGFASIHNTKVAIIATQNAAAAGCLNSDGLKKASRFVMLCDAMHIPIVSFVDSQGFMPGVQQELTGIAREAARLAQAYQQATVAKINILTGNAIGGAFLLFAGSWCGADLIYAWQDSVVAPTNSQAMLQLMYHNKMLEVSDPSQHRTKLAEEVKNDHASTVAAKKVGYINDIISPQETLLMISNGLTLFTNKNKSTLAKKHSVSPV